VIGGVLDLRDPGENWDEVLRMTASIKAGTVAPSVILRQLAAYPRQNALAKSLREIGRLERTLLRRDNQDENRATIRMRMRRRGGDEGRA
jgi:TnpA family transposase